MFKEGKHKMPRKKISLRIVLSVLLIVTIIAPMSSKVYASDEYDGLREKYKIKLTGYDASNPYDINNTYIKLSLEALDANAGNIWTLMNKSTYTWDDYMASSASNSAQLSTIASRLRKMAEAWATYGSDYYGNTSLLNDTINGLEWFYNNRYNTTCPTYGNWWDWQIGVSLSLNDAVILLYDQLTSTQRTNYMNAVDRFTPQVTMTGANRAWQAKIICIRAIIVKDSTKLQSSSDGLDDLFIYSSPGEESGFYTDGSYIQHTYYPYAGGYGKQLIIELSQMLWLLDGSTWDNNDLNKGNVYNWVFNTFEPAVFNGAMLQSTMGREVSRYSSSNSASASSVINSLISLSEMSGNPYANTFKSIVKYHMQNGYQDLHLRTNYRWNIVKIQSIINDTGISPTSERIGNFQFYNEDRVVHKRPGWTFDIAMHSNRIRNYESINNENLKQWYTGDGMTYLYKDASDYVNNFWPTIDPSRLPGITVDRDTARTGTTGANTLMTNSWVGGVSLEGVYGTAGMDFKQHNSPESPSMDLSAKKSWFMFDNEVVALGAGINSTSGRTIETVVDNRFLNSAGNNNLIVDGTGKSTSIGWSETINNANWIQLDGTGGYVFPQGATVNGLRERREGKWQDINTLTYQLADDEFNSTAQKAVWSWVREDSTNHVLTGTSQTITTQPGTLEGSVNSTRNIMVASSPQGDFYTETKLTFIPTEEGQEAGLIMYRGDDNYVYISRKHTSQGNKITAVNESSGIPVTNMYSDTYGDTVYFKIDKSGSNYFLYASNDGSTWGTALCSCSNSMAGTDGANSGLKIGIFAQNGTNDSAPQIVASFDYNHIKVVKNYMTLWIDHGINPVNASYSYITLPGKSSEEVAAYSSNPDTRVLRNDTVAQAVEETGLGITGVNFWQAGNVAYIASSNPAAVMVKDMNNQLSIAVSDPTHNQNTVRVELSKSGVSVISHDSSVTVVQLAPTIILDINVSADRGKSHNATIAYDPLAPALTRIVTRFNPEADSYVRDGSYADYNYGTAGYLVVEQQVEGYNRNAYIRYDLGNISGEVSKATLYLYGCVSDSGGSETDNSIYAVADDSWSETGITWNNKPAAGDYINTVHMNSTSVYRTVDVTSYIQSQCSGDKKASLVLQQDNTGYFTQISSRETNYIPYLLVEYYPGKMINPEADSYVRDGIYADSNYGTAGNLVIKNSAENYNRQTYLRYDLSNVSGEIASAVLYLYGGVTDGNGTESDCKIYGVANDTWTETGITWNNKPAAGDYLNTVHMNDTFMYRTVDVTSYIQSQYSGDKKASLVMLQENAGYFIQVDSRETNYKPILKIMTYQSLCPEADSYVRDGTYADSNYGTAGNLVIKNSAENYNRQTYLRYDLSNVSWEIASAVLYLYGGVTDGNGTESDCKIYGVANDTWTETGITWNNKPAAGDYLNTVHMNDTFMYRMVDVTSYIQSQYSGDKKASLVMLQENEGYFTQVDSRETNYKPYLKYSFH